jgi:hypothetical protein
MKLSQNLHRLPNLENGNVSSCSHMHLYCIIVYGIRRQHNMIQEAQKFFQINQIMTTIHYAPHILRNTVKVHYNALQYTVDWIYHEFRHVS